ncbi:5-formyltetrahydrofolate cyclo-ligase [Ferrovibrio sp.]|uniref:5-formyltetrahydrofolate cyclo-ligase n=1 Tax=Ferrovibrio sp. TaxID=1917215 RepID=UPI003D110111
MAQIDDLDDIQAAKAALRPKLRQRRQEASNANGAAIAGVAAERFIAGIPLTPGMAIAGYWPLPSEIDPRPLLARLRAEFAARILLPAVRADSLPLGFRLWDGDEAKLLPGRYGIPAPPESAVDVRPDLVLVPLLGFDRQGGRLGLGAGYYDATLGALRRDGMKPPLCVGYAFAVQQVPEVPCWARDERLDWVVTERGAIKCKEEGG